MHKALAKSPLSYVTGRGKKGRGGKGELKFTFHNHFNPQFRSLLYRAFSGSGNEELILLIFSCPFPCVNVKNKRGGNNPEHFSKRKKILKCHGEGPGDRASSSGIDTVVLLCDLERITASLGLSFPHLNPNDSMPHPLFKHRLQVRPQGSKTETGLHTEPLGGGKGFHRPPLGFGGEQTAPPAKPLGQLQVANKNLLARTPLGRASLSQHARRLGSRPTGKEDGSPGRGRPPRTHAPTRMSRAGPPGGVSAIPRGTKGSWSLALPPPSPLCCGGGVGRENLVPGEEKGAPFQPEGERIGPGSWTQGTPPPTPGGNGRWALHRGERESRLGSGGKGRLARGGAESAPGRTGVGISSCKVERVRAWRGSGSGVGVRGALDSENIKGRAPR